MANAIPGLAEDTSFRGPSRIPLQHVKICTGIPDFMCPPSFGIVDFFPGTQIYPISRLCSSRAIGFQTPPAQCAVGPRNSVTYIGSPLGHRSAYGYRQLLNGIRRIHFSDGQTEGAIIVVWRLSPRRCSQGLESGDGRSSLGAARLSWPAHPSWDRGPKQRGAWRIGRQNVEARRGARRNPPGCRNTGLPREMVHSDLGNYLTNTAKSTISAQRTYRRATQLHRYSLRLTYMIYII